jgi:uncharacterized protein (TIGR01732 family)
MSEEYGGYGGGRQLAFILVLFILLVIIGTTVVRY